MKKSKNPESEFNEKVYLAYTNARQDTWHQNLPEAKAAFVEHWGPAVAAIEKILAHAANESLVGREGQLLGVLCPRIAQVLELIYPFVRGTRFPYVARNRHAGEFVFETAQRMAREVVALAQRHPPPAWLVERAAMEYEVPWLMVNGKPAPGFAESDAALAWGHTFTKRSKNGKRSHNDFDAPQTRDVAAALHELNYFRKHFRDSPETLRTVCRGAPPKWRARYRAIAALPPLCRATAARWWPLVRDNIRRNPALTEQEKRNIRASLDYDTPAALVNEYLKRCKLAFAGLCPADAPGENSPESYPCRQEPNRVSTCPIEADIRPHAKTERAHHERAGTRSTESEPAGMGRNPRRSPRDHAGRDRIKRRTR